MGVSSSSAGGGGTGIISCYKHRPQHKVSTAPQHKKLDPSERDESAFGPFIKQAESPFPAPAAAPATEGGSVAVTAATKDQSNDQSIAVTAPTAPQTAIDSKPSATVITAVNGVSTPTGASSTDPNGGGSGSGRDERKSLSATPNTNPAPIAVTSVSGTPSPKSVLPAVAVDQKTATPDSAQSTAATASGSGGAAHGAGVWAELYRAAEACAKRISEAEGDANQKGVMCASLVQSVREAQSAMSNQMVVTAETLWERYDTAHRGVLTHAECRRMLQNSFLEIKGLMPGFASKVYDTFWSNVYSHSLLYNNPIGRLVGNVGRDKWIRDFDTGIAARIKQITASASASASDDLVPDSLTAQVMKSIAESPTNAGTGSSGSGGSAAGNAAGSETVTKQQFVAKFAPLVLELVQFDKVYALLMSDAIDKASSDLLTLVKSAK